MKRFIALLLVAIMLFSGMTVFAEDSRPCSKCKGKGTVIVNCNKCYNKKHDGKCSWCYGTGWYRGEVGFQCNNCHGSGRCPGCDGTGKTEVMCKTCGGSGYAKAKHGPARMGAEEMTVGRIPTWTFIHLLGENGISCGRVIMTNTGDGICFTLSMEDKNDPRIGDAYFLLFPEGAAEGEKHLYGETVAVAEGTRILPVVGEIDRFLTAEQDILYIA